jgi:hypothetical protein
MRKTIEKLSLQRFIEQIGEIAFPIAVPMWNILACHEGGTKMNRSLKASTKRLTTNLMRALWVTPAVAGCLTQFSSTSANAWGLVGHQVVAQVAEWHLCPATSMQVQAILQGQTIESVASWADQVRNTSEFSNTRSWHFSNIPMGSSYAATPVPASGDVVTAIANQLEILRTKTGVEQQNALKFIIHFVGDAHQPFHALADKRGANQINVGWFGKNDNLHAVWDTGIIERTGLDMVSVAKAANDPAQTGPAEVDQLAPESWVNESVVIAGFAMPAGAEADGAKPILAGPYEDRYTPIVFQRLRAAGYRLAGVLNEALGNCATP